MACPDVFNALKVATESLDTDVSRIATYKSVWMNAINRSTYKSGTGLTQTTFQIANTEPTTDEESWAAITLANGTNQGACGGSFSDVNVGFTERTYSPKRAALRGPVICADDLTYDHRVDLFLKAYVEELGKRANRTWEKYYENEYMTLARKAVATSASGLTLVSTAGVISAIQLSDSTHTLSQDQLDVAALELIDAGATSPDSNGWINFGDDGPVFPLLIGIEASQAIAKNNSEFRNDIRYSEPNELLKRLGAARVIKNFRHVINLRPARYSRNVDGTFDRINTYVESDATKGKQSTVNPAWKTAVYEAAVVLNPSVMTCEVVKPTSSAGGLSWNAQNYTGEWQFVVGGEKWEATCADPLGKLGRHFCEMVAAIRPENPTHGMTIIFKR